jgi:hypothetical protein
MNDDGVIDASDNNFPRFVHFWIDGRILVRYLDYNVNAGSTVITLNSKNRRNVLCGRLCGNARQRVYESDTRLYPISVRVR